MQLTSSIICCISPISLKLFRKLILAFFSRYTNVGCWWITGAVFMALTVYLFSILEISVNNKNKCWMKWRLHQKTSSSRWCQCIFVCRLHQVITLQSLKNSMHYTLYKLSAQSLDHKVWTYNFFPKNQIQIF